MSTEAVAPKEPRKKSMTLYDINDQLLRIDYLIMEAEGEITPDIADLLDAMEFARDKKLDNITAMVQEKLSLAEAAKVEARRLYALAKVRENAAKGLKDYMEREMSRTGTTKVETDRFKISRVRNSQPGCGFTGDDPNEIPEEFRKEPPPPPPPELDTDKVKEVWRTYFDEELIKVNDEMPGLDKVEQAMEAGRRANDRLPKTIQVELGSHLRIK